MDVEVKIVVVGDEGVGKSCLINTYLNGEFPQTEIANVF